MMGRPSVERKLIGAVRQTRSDEFPPTSVLIGWFDEPRLRGLSPVVEQLADA